MQGMVIAHIDYANTQYARLPKVTTDRLQHIQNIAVRVTLQLPSEQFYRMPEYSALVTGAMEG